MIHDYLHPDDPQNFRSPYMTEVMVEEAKRQQRRKQRSERKGKRKEGEKDECSSDSGEILIVEILIYIPLNWGGAQNVSLIILNMQILNVCKEV